MKKHITWDDSKNWFEDFHLENGCYTNTCVHCKEEFLGHKRRPLCKECYEKLKEKYPDTK